MDKRMEINKVVKESLMEALLYYMNKKPFSSITVTELIKKAGVARATYYRNFDSKEDLAREYLATIAVEFSSDNFLDESSTAKERMLSSWKYIAKYKDVLKLYNNAGLADLLIGSLSDIALYKFDSKKFPEINDMYFAAYVGALFCVARKWIIDGAKIPYEVMAERFAELWSNRTLA